MAKPFFSVIIPSYNRAYILGRAIQSVLNQTYKQFELIIVDDGSNDHTRSLVASYIDPRIQYLYQNNSGVCAARNHAANKAKGKYLVFLDSDDLLMNNCLHQYFKIAQIQNATLIFSNMIRINPTTKNKKSIDARKPKGYGTGNFLAGAFCISHRLFSKAGGYDCNLTFAENSELSYRVLNLKPEVGFTDKVGLVYETSLNGGSQNYCRIVDSSIYIIKKHSNNKILKPSIKRFILENAAIAAIMLKDYKKGRNLLWQAYIKQPWQLKTFSKLLIAHFPILANKLWNTNGSSSS